VEFHQNNKHKINKQSDIYSIGAILYKLLLGVPPQQEIAEFIAKKKLNEKSPQ
jgi:serine/threonine protein kinase